MLITAQARESVYKVGIPFSAVKMRTMLIHILRFGVAVMVVSLEWLIEITVDVPFKFK